MLSFACLMKRDFCNEDRKRWNPEMEEERYFLETINLRVLKFLESSFKELNMTMCGIERCFSGKIVGPVERPGYHLHVVFSGKGELRVGENAYRVRAGQFFLTMPEETVWYKADEKEPWYYCWITLDGTQAWEYLKNAGFTEEKHVLKCNIETSRFIPIIDAMLKNPRLSQSNDLYRHGLACEFLSLAIESHEKTVQVSTRNRDISVEDYINLAISYINENYSNAKISELAKFIGINRNYFASIFKQKMCISPQEYLMEIRMGKATEMLMETDFPIGKVSRSVGYENQMTFSKMFKKKYGVSPEAYRAENKERV